MLKPKLMKGGKWYLMEHQWTQWQNECNHPEVIVLEWNLISEFCDMLNGKPLNEMQLHGTSMNFYFSMERQPTKSLLFYGTTVNSILSGN